MNMKEVGGFEMKEVKFYTLKERTPKNGELIGVLKHSTGVLFGNVYFPCKGKPEIYKDDYFEINGGRDRDISFDRWDYYCLCKDLSPLSEETYKNQSRKSHNG